MRLLISSPFHPHYNSVTTLSIIICIKTNTTIAFVSHVKRNQNLRNHAAVHTHCNAQQYTTLGNEHPSSAWSNSYFCAKILLAADSLWAGIEPNNHK
jgi:hypothetical protein